MTVLGWVRRVRAVSLSRVAGVAGVTAIGRRRRLVAAPWVVKFGIVFKASTKACSLLGCVRSERGRRSRTRVDLRGSATLTRMVLLAKLWMSGQR